jgi:aarF domain-containing kinase
MAVASRRICVSCLASISKRPFLSPLQVQQTRAARPFSSTRARAAFVPPSPESLGRAVPAKQYKRTRKWLRRLGYVTLLGAAGYIVDQNFFASAVTRSVRTFALGLTVALDYKINFRENPPFADDVTEVHARNAAKLANLLRKNGGLYLKIGQAIAMQSAILPPEFQKMFSTMFDDAPQNDWESVRRVIMEDFGGRTPEEVFGVSFDGDPEKGVMERKARASASVAQVHWARLPDGREVAIKIQKEEISKQVGADLFSFKVVTRIYSWWFDLPFYTLVPYITERLNLECDFQNEAKNSRHMAECVANEPRLRDRVYIPKVYDELSSRRVMTAEWIEGVRLRDKDAITKSWRGGWRTGSPGCHGTPLDPPETSLPALQRKAQSTNAQLKPDRNYWRGKDGQGGLGLNLSEVMTTMVDLFSAQMFMWGWVHCDPHPGNIFIRRLPNGHSELVLIDHGLYIEMTPQFRHQYSLFWKSMMTFDNATMSAVVKDWGVNDSGLFASATLMRPYEGDKDRIQKKFRDISSEKDARKRHYEMQQASRKIVREILSDENKWPKELIFIGRNMRIVQGNNQYLGSPVNRIKITGSWASRALAEDRALSSGERWKYWVGHLMFKVVLLGSDVYWWWARARQWVGRGKGMDDDMEQSMKKIAEGYGIEMQHDVFEG